MPADFDDVGEELDRLRADVDQVSWVESPALRERGRRRARRRTVAGTLAVCLGIGGLGLSVTGNLPGQKTLIADQAAPGVRALQSEQERARSEQPSKRSTVTASRRTSGTSHQVPTDDESTEGTTPRSGTRPGTPASPGHPTTPGKVTPTTDPTSVPPTTQPAPGTPSSTPAPTSPTPTPGPSTPSTPPAPKADPAALIDATDMPKVDPSELTWAETGTTTGEGERPSCQPVSLTSAGATGAYRRDFRWGAADSKVDGSTVVGAFESAEDATKAYDKVVEEVTACAWGTVKAPVDVQVESGVARWWLVGKSSETTSEFEAVGVVRRGSAVVTVVVHSGTSADWTYDQDPMAPALRVAAAKLASYSD